MKTCFAFLAALAACAVPVAAHADTIDQQNTTYTYATASNTGAGQSFTTTMNTFSFAMFDLKGSGKTVADVKLLLGAGLGGAVLATSDSLAIADCGFDAYTFTFAPTTLTVGGVYTLAIDLVSGGQLQELFSTGKYAGGMAYGASGTGYSGYDLTFAEGGHNAQVTPVATTPEPSSLMLLGTGAMGVAGMLRRRMRRA